MFNLTVDTAHTFYVGEHGWLVHNCEPLFSERFGVEFNPLKGVLDSRKAALTRALEGAPDIGIYTREYYTTLEINNKSVLAAIDHTYGSTKGWLKVVEDGLDGAGGKVGFHYFRGPNGQVFGEKFVDFWTRDFSR